MLATYQLLFQINLSLNPQNAYDIPDIISNRFILTQSNHIHIYQMHHLNISNVNSGGGGVMQRRNAIVFYCGWKKKNGLSRQARIVPWKKRISLSSVLDAVQKRRDAKRTGSFYPLVSKAGICTRAAPWGADRSNSPLVTREFENSPIAEHGSSGRACRCPLVSFFSLFFFYAKSSFPVIRASVNVGRRFCKSRRRDIG